MKKIKYIKTVTSVQGATQFEHLLMEECQRVQDAGFEVDIKYAIENTSAHAALVIGYLEENTETINTNV